MKGSILKDKSYKLALRIVSLYKYLIDKNNEFALSRQVLRAGTSIGALIMEAEFAQSKADFISKMSIALKEANETSYWLNILKDTMYLSHKEFFSINEDCLEVLKMLVSTIKTAKKNNKS